jgi:outer membrane lipoprotein
MKHVILLSLAITVTSCASSVPLAIRTPPAENPSIAAVREQPQRFVDAQIRWGGTIAVVENRQSETQVEIVARKLQSNGRPKDEYDSGGRFQATISGFLDPVIYEKGRSLTVVGRVKGEFNGKIGEHPYRFPVVEVTDYFLWPPLPKRIYYNPWYYDPWYYDPWGPYPYYPRRYHHW